MVTGVTSGIGRSIAGLLIDDGTIVAGVGRDPQALAGLAAEWGERFVPIRADLAVPADRAAAARRIIDRFGTVDLLVNNAGIAAYRSPLELDVARWRELFEVNVLAGVELTQALVPVMPHGSLLVNVSSASTRFLANPRFAPYAISKAALEGATEAVRMELTGRGVKVTLVVPGLVDTPIYAKTEGSERVAAKLAELVPLWLSPEDVAKAVHWIVRQPAHVVIAELVVMPAGQAR